LFEIVVETVHQFHTTAQESVVIQFTVQSSLIDCIDSSDGQEETLD